MSQVANAFSGPFATARSVASSARSSLDRVLHGLADWWNAVELWILGLSFGFQFALVMAVLLPLCVMVAWLIDRIVDYTSAWFGPSNDDEPPLGSAR